ncbi:hypothetical protein R2R35_18385 [Anaerocolumna sp. AGMB13020]|uniref:hypothetical protein n=1 Tax=Anaerocolumna sp. AGMB13020 TaxID=3081750 RepID=UPI002953E001|nr:hypothetical protein [Anaerocolumna sp. AGMB13020]WOO35749.1 hypothetical protein R2R35_18385 [Anaerocolumna sp. AGMB13020]
MKRENIPIIIGFILCLILLYGGKESMNNGYWALVVALISVAGTLVAHLISFRKDSNKIGSVKEDTSKMTPQVNNIDENTKKIRDQVIEQIIPSINQFKDSRIGISELVEDLRYQKRLKQETLPYVNNMDTFISGIKNVYDVNARLAFELKEEREKTQFLTLENNQLKAELYKYKEKSFTKSKDELER